MLSRELASSHSFPSVVDCTDVTAKSAAWYKYLVALHAAFRVVALKCQRKSSRSWTWYRVGWKREQYWSAVSNSCHSVPARIITFAGMQGLMAAAFLLSGYVDKYIAASQRASLGLCVKCGGLDEGTCNDDACPRRSTPDQSSG
jgi:hypothetical protein